MSCATVTAVATPGTGELGPSIPRGTVGNIGQAFILYTQSGCKRPFCSAKRTMPLPSERYSPDCPAFSWETTAAGGVVLLSDEVHRLFGPTPEVVRARFNTT